MKIKDHFLSKETFSVTETDNKGIFITSPIPKDIDKYYESKNYLSHIKNKSIKSKLYQVIQKLNENYKLKIIRKYRNYGNILDYGCGDGSFLNFIKTKNFTPYGYEPNKTAFNIVKEKFGKKNIYNSIKEIPDHSMDIISLWHVLEHIPNPENILNQFKEKLSYKGYLIIAIPNHQSLDCKFYKEYWAAWDVPRHIFHYSKNGAIDYFTKNNWEVLHTYPLPFDSFYISLMSEIYKKNKLGIFRFPFIATLSNIKAMINGNYSSIIYVLKNNV